MASLTGIIQGIGSEAPFVEKGRQTRRQEKREDFQDQLAKRRVDIQEEGVQSRLAELQRRLQKDQEWKTVGSAKQMKDGSWAQMQFQPESGQTRFVPVPAPEGGEFMSPEETIVAKNRGKADAYQSFEKSLIEQGIDPKRRQQMLDRFWDPKERMQWINTQSGIVGFNNMPNPTGPSSIMTPFKGYPPGWGNFQPPPELPLDATDWGYIDQMGSNRMTLDQVKKLYAGRNEYKLPIMVGQAIQRGFDPNATLTGAAAQQVATAQAQIDINRPLIDLIDKLGLKNNNRLGYLMWSRMKYGAGVGTAGGLADEIANLELTKVTSAANALKGSSRAWAALSLALQHTPNVWVDSPMLIRQKLETINQRLQAVIAEQRQFGTKSGLPNQGGDIPQGVTGTVELPGKGAIKLGGQDNQSMEQPVAPVRQPNAQPPNQP